MSYARYLTPPNDPIICDPYDHTHKHIQKACCVHSFFRSIGTYADWRLHAGG